MPTAQNQHQIRVDDFGVHFEILVGGTNEKPIYKHVGVETSFTMGDGETIVIGASQIIEDPKLPASAIVVVVTARILG